MRILTVPEDTKILRSKSREISTIDDELVKFLGDLGKTLKRQSDPQGIGLSAVQVGRPVRVFATLLESELVFYINPEIISHPDELTLGEDLVDPPKDRQTSHLGGQERIRPFLEGCLSIPKVYGTVLRWPWINARATVISGNDLLDISKYRRSNLGLIDVSLNGLAGRVFQHELDHLNGILFTDHTMAQNGIMYREEKDRLEEIIL